MRGDDLRLSRRAIDRYGRSLRVAAEPDALGAGAHRDALVGENGPDGLRNPLVLAGDQARPLLDDRDLGPEAPVHLRELEPDVAAADDDEMLGHPVEAQDRAVGQVIDLTDARHVGHGGAPADVDEDAGRRQQRLPDPDRVRALETGVPLHDRAAGHAAQPLLDARTRIGGDGVGPRLDARHVDLDGAVEHDAVLAAAAREMGRIGARDHRLRRRAAGVDAGAAEEIPLDDGDRHFGPGEPIGERRAGLPGPDDDRIEPVGHRALPYSAASSRRPGCPQPRPRGCRSGRRRELRSRSHWNITRLRRHR